MIGIIDYGLGNIKAFANIYHRLHIPVKILHKSEDFAEVSKLILPGVGAFDHAIKTFNDSGMRDITESMVLDQKIPVIGICVGMQMLASSSEEGVLPVLGWIAGEVKRFDASKIEYETHLPHMGWNDVEVNKQSILFNDLESLPRFYFLHSYYFHCANPENIIASSQYGDTFTCVVGNDNIYGVQFHPEKSHQFGVKLLENFSKI